MLDFVLHALRANPEIAVFLAISLGVLLAGFKSAASI